jgi:cytochrome o ubiquinol oxidase subunit 1
MGWQGLFIVAAIGLLVILVGVGFQLLQFAVSFIQREDNRDLTGDPWDGRTLEWSTSSPPAVYNFAHLPAVHDRDAFWAAKKHKTPLGSDEYEDITLPKNSGAGLGIALAAFVFGFAVIWHIYWVLPFALLAIIVILLVRANNEHTEYTIKAATIEKIELGRAGAKV